MIAIALLSNLAKLLRARVGRGYSRPNLNNMRKFYLMYPICQTSDKSGLPYLQANGICQTSDKLTWSHICELVTIDDQLERDFYEKECISEGWTVNELHRQKEDGLFMRLAVSKDKQGVLTLAHEGQQVQTPQPHSPQHGGCGCRWRHHHVETVIFRRINIFRAGQSVRPKLLVYNAYRF